MGNSMTTNGRPMFEAVGMYDGSGRDPMVVQQEFFDKAASPPPPRAFTIPVAFLVEGDDEFDAARHLADILDDRDMLSPIRIEKWWMPNHPLVDGSDNEAALVFVPYEWADTPEERQLNANLAQRAMREFMNECAGAEDEHYRWFLGDRICNECDGNEEHKKGCLVALIEARKAGQ